MSRPGTPRIPNYALVLYVLLLAVGATMTLRRTLLPALSFVFGIVIVLILAEMLGVGGLSPQPEETGASPPGVPPPTPSAEAEATKPAAVGEPWTAADVEGGDVSTVFEFATSPVQEMGPDGVKPEFSDREVLEKALKQNSQGDFQGFAPIPGHLETFADQEALTKRLKRWLGAEGGRGRYFVVAYMDSFCTFSKAFYTMQSDKDAPRPAGVGVPLFAVVPGRGMPSPQIEVWGPTDDAAERDAYAPCARAFGALPPANLRAWFQSVVAARTKI